jgi:hypothetical protein
VPGGVDHTGDNHDFLGFDDLVNDSIRKSIGESPPDVFSRVASRIDVRVNRPGVVHTKDLLHQFIPRGLVAVGRTSQRLPSRCRRFRAHDHGPAHTALRLRNRAFISSSGTDDWGFARCAASLDSIRASSAADNGGSSNSTARLMRICRSSSVKAGSCSRTAWRNYHRFSTNLLAYVERSLLR